MAILYITMVDRCRAIKRSGEICSNRAKYGAYCGIHKSFLGRQIMHTLTEHPDDDPCSLVSNLDQYEIGNIVEFMSYFDSVLVRATCARCAIIPVRTTKISTPKDAADRLLIESAESGHRDLCELAREWGATKFNDMLESAADGGHRELCELAREWGATEFNKMLWRAAEGGHRGLCELAREWGATNFDGMLRYAAGGGHRELCELAREWGANNFDVMLWDAALGGHRELCELAREWGLESLTPMDFNGMLQFAVLGDHRELCELAREWGATDR